MRQMKRTSFSAKTRTRGARFRFTFDPTAQGAVLRKIYSYECDCEGGVLQNSPEWAPVYNQSGNQYKCNVSNLLEIGSWKVDDNYTDTYQNCYYAISTTGAFYIYREDKQAFLTVLTNGTKVHFQPLMTSDGCRYALFTEGRLLIGKTDGAYTTVIATNVVPAGTYFRHRLFVGKKNGVLAYSAPEDFTNFTESVQEGGSIRFPDAGGEIIAVKVYDDALYVFFTSGIMRLEVGGDPCDFRAEKIDYRGGDIFYRTICVYDHGIHFLARNGLYRLKGKKVERLDTTLNFCEEESGAENCAVWKGRTLIRYRNANKIYQTLSISEDGTVEPFTMMRGFANGQDGRVLLVDSLKKVYQLTGANQGTIWYEGTFETEHSNLGYVGRKTLRKVRLYGEGELDLMISNGHTYQRKKMNFMNGVVEWSMGFSGDTFAFTFTLQRSTKVREVYVEFETLTEYKEEKV